MSRRSNSPVPVLLLLLLWYVNTQQSPNSAAGAGASQEDSSFSFSFSSFDDASCSGSSMCLIGDASLRNGSIELTSINGEGQSAGRAMLATPVSLVNRDAKTTASFRSSFTFSIMNQDEIHYGDGLAFIIVKQQNVSGIGGPGGWLGFLSAMEEQQGKNLAVEFDTYLNVEFGDPNDNHVGVDVNSMRSIGFADAGSESVQLKSGKPITAWIEYDSSRQELEVSLSYNKEEKPQKRLLSLSVNLCALLDENMYVGFSAATGGNVELHTLHSWSFASFGLEAPVASTVGDGDHDHTSAPPAPSPVHSTSSSSSSSRCSNRKLACLATARFLAISTASAIAGAIAVSVMLWLICSYRPNMSIRLRSLKRSTSFSSMVGGPRKFTYKELSSATKGFSPSKVLGHGAFGTVFKGQMHLEDGSEVQVAVKRADKGSKHGKEEFMSELSIIGCLRHRNLVQLQGWCRERGELLLVYDYMPNGSLDKLLFGGSGTNLLSWSCRLKIVVGVGAALAYLHSEWEQRVVHRDVKASNIMLDANLNARLGDFGLARLIEHDSSPETTITAGTLGYLAPEYLHTGKATEKTDVFSFGIVVLEVATGRRPILDNKDDNKKAEFQESSSASLLLVDWVWKLHNQGKLMEAADPKLRGEFEQQEMLLLLQVGLLCSHPDPGARPTMKQVVQILCGATSIPPLPKLKPTPSFASVPPLSIQDIMSDTSI